MMSNYVIGASLVVSVWGFLFFHATFGSVHFISRQMSQ